MALELSEEVFAQSEEEKFVMLFEKRQELETHENPVDDQPFLMRDEVDLDEKGALGVPILLWLLGVPGLLVIVLWFFFFKG